MFNITNNFEHPTRPGYFVFRFREKVRADYFEELLKKEGVWFEKSEAGNSGQRHVDFRHGHR